MTMTPVFPIDFNDVRIAFFESIKKVTLLDQQHIIYEQPETQDVTRPKEKPYMSFFLTVPASKTGDDSKRYVSGNKWNSGGVRKMTVSFNSYGRSHEEAYNYMCLWQTALDLEDIQEDLRRSGIAVWIIGNVADLSKLLNTGYEGRSHMECTFGIAANLVSDLGSIDTVPVHGKIFTQDGQEIDTDQTISKEG